MRKVELTRTDPSVGVKLTDTRAASPITVTYDFERDGYAIRQDLIRDSDGIIEVLKELEEVGFIPAWNEELDK